MTKIFGNKTSSSKLLEQIHELKKWPANKRLKTNHLKQLSKQCRTLVPQPRWQRIAKHHASSVDLSPRASITTCCRQTTAMTCCSWSHWNGTSIPQKSSSAYTADGCPGWFDWGCPPLCRHRCTQSKKHRQLTSIVNVCLWYCNQTTKHELIWNWWEKYLQN